MRIIKGIIPFLIVSMTSIFWTTPRPANGDIAKRVNNVRKELKKKVESGNYKDISGSFFTNSNIKDWVNWANWGNWNNWNNWSNWSKWSKWDNWVNWANSWGNTK